MGRHLPCASTLAIGIIARRYASAVHAVIVCLSVRPSVTSRSSTKKAKPGITQTAPYDSPGTLSVKS